MVSAVLGLRSSGLGLRSLLLLNALCAAAALADPGAALLPPFAREALALPSDPGGAAAGFALAGVSGALGPLGRAVHRVFAWFGSLPGEGPADALDQPAWSAVAQPPAQLHATGGLPTRPSSTIGSPIELRRLERHAAVESVVARPAVARRRGSLLQLYELPRELARMWMGRTSAGGFCATDASDVGRSDGEAGRRPLDPGARYRGCEPEQVEHRASEYEKAYHVGLRRLCSETIEDEARLAAETGSAPSELTERCFTEQRAVRERYQSAFGQARTRVIAARCTFEQGLGAGRADAERRAERDTSQPGFCDGTHYYFYLTGYVEGWRDGKEATCDEQAAYDDGVRDGGMGGRPSYQPPTVCAGSYGDRMRGRYGDGFRTGELLRRREPDASRRTAQAGGIAP